MREAAASRETSGEETRLEVDGEVVAQGDDELADAIGELSAHIHAATCRLLELIAEFDRRLAWADWGARSCAQWLSWRCGIGLVAAREKIRVAHALRELPQVHEAFRWGRLSYSKVRAITRVATPATETHLVELARATTAAQVERIVRYRRRCERAARNPGGGRDHGLRWHWDEEGCLVVEARLPAEQGALVQNALELAAEAIRTEQRPDAEHDSAETSRAANDDSAETPQPDHDSAETPPPNHDSAETPPRDDDEPVRKAGVPLAASGYEAPEVRMRRRGQALARVAETWLAHGSRSLPGGERQQIVVHLDPEAVRRDEASDGRRHVEGGGALSRETARRLGCDASLLGMVEDARGEPLSVGRRTRAIPAAIARALRLRDDGCRFPGCRARRFVDGHHVEHWADGGETRLDNLVQLCRTHHRLVHEGGFRVERTAEGDFRFRRPDGRLLDAVPEPPPMPAPGAAPILTRHRTSGFRPAANTAEATEGITRIDHRLTQAILDQHDPVAPS